jgi:hypothetical protein
LGCKWDGQMRVLFRKIDKQTLGSLETNSTIICKFYETTYNSLTDTFHLVFNRHALKTLEMPMCILRIRKCTILILLMSIHDVHVTNINKHWVGSDIILASHCTRTGEAHLSVINAMFLQQNSNIAGY